MQEDEIWPNKQMVYRQPWIYPGERDAQNLWNFEMQTNHGQTTRHSNYQLKKKEKLPVDQRIKLKENKKKDKYRDFASELKKSGAWK